MNLENDMEIYCTEVVGQTMCCPICDDESIRLVEVVISKDGYINRINDSGVGIVKAGMEIDGMLMNITYRCNNCWSRWINRQHMNGSIEYETWHG